MLFVDNSPLAQIICCYFNKVKNQLKKNIWENRKKTAVSEGEVQQIKGFDQQIQK